jgi:MraZ protein
MFLGQHPLTLDNQGRLALPERVRALIGDGAVLTQGFDRNLLVMTRPFFAGLSQRTGALNMTDPSARMLRRMLLGSAFELTIDESGRIGLPEGLRAFAGLGGDVVLVGQGDYLEIWDAEQWKVQQGRLGDVESNSARFAALDIALV